MLVTFKTEAYASITMFGDVAIALLKLMDHSGTIPGALMPADIPDALKRLEAGVAANPDGPLDPKDPKADKGEEDDEDRPRISLSHRAMPLIELLKAAKAANRHVTWES